MDQGYYMFQVQYLPVRYMDSSGQVFCIET